MEEFFSKDELTNSREVELSQRCLDLKKIVAENRIFLVAQVVIDAFLLYLLVFRAMASGGSLFWAASLGIIIKLSLTIALRNIIGDLSGCALGALLLGLLLINKDSDILVTATFLTGILVSLLRIRTCLCVRAIKQVYGFPSFNGFLIANECRNDQGLFKIVKEQYDQVSSRPIVSSCIADQHRSFVLRLVRLMSMVIAILGLCFFTYSRSTLITLDSAKDIDLSSPLHDGQVVKGETDFLYIQAGYSVERHVDDSYWARIGDEATGKYIVITVPASLKYDYATLYNGHAPIDMMEMKRIYYYGYKMIYEEYTGKRNFVGFIREAKGDFPTIKPERLAGQELGTVSKYYIELVDRDQTEAGRQSGLILLLGGSALIILTSILFFMNRYEIKEI